MFSEVSWSMKVVSVTSWPLSFSFRGIHKRSPLLGWDGVSKFYMFWDGGGEVCFTRGIIIIWWFLIDFLINESFFLCVSHTHFVFRSLKTRQSIRDTWLGTLMWLDFVGRTVCSIYLYIMWTNTEYISLQTVP